jgi:hypothetical protein
MAIKTFECPDKESFDTLVNEFEKNHQVFATQTHVTPIVEDGSTTKFIYVAVVFYREAKQ